MSPDYRVLPAADRDLDEQAEYLGRQVGLEMHLISNRPAGDDIEIVPVLHRARHIDRGYATRPMSRGPRWGIISPTPCVVSWGTDGLGHVLRLAVVDHRFGAVGGEPVAILGDALAVIRHPLSVSSLATSSQK